MSLADAEAFQMLIASTATAGLAYSAKQIVNGDAERLGDAEYIAKGALNWSPMLSPALMVADPLSHALGLDAVPGNPFPLNNWRYQHGGLFSLPAGLSAANSLVGLGGLPADTLDGDGLSRDTINGIKAIPVIGRSYPMIPIIEALEKD